MSNAPGSREPVRLLSRFHNSKVLKKYGSSQKGLRKINYFFGQAPLLNYSSLWLNQPTSLIYFTMHLVFQVH